MRRTPLLLLAASVASLSPHVLRAQTEVAVELGASQVGPAVSSEGESSRFGVAGVRVSHFAPAGSSASASLMFGRTLGDSIAGNFVSAVVTGGLRDRWGRSWTAGWDLELVGFEVRTPFPFLAMALESGPSLSVRAGPVTVTAAGIFGVGRSRIELWRRVDGVHRVFENDLWRIGGTAELLVGGGPFSLGVTGGAHDGPSGTYTSGGARALLSGDWGAIQARADLWSTPLGTGPEVIGGLTFVIPMSSWSLRGFLGKSEPDPLTLTEPGRGGGGLLLSTVVLGGSADRETVARPYEILRETAGIARVRIRLTVAEGESVALLGDFTLWDPVPMKRDGEGWIAEVDVAYGTHHFGFLVDDEWHVPDDFGAVVPDEWGRESAILVIEGAS